MKSILIIPSLLSLLFVDSLLSPADARLSLKDVDSRSVTHGATKRRVNRYYRHDNPEIKNWALGKFPGDFSNSVGVETSLGWRYTGCDVQDTSPIYEDVIGSVADHIATKGGQSCIPEEPSTLHCTLITTTLSAKVYFCGKPGILITCSELADIIFALCGECTDRVNNNFRVRGTVALFPGGYPLDYSKLSFITIVGHDDNTFEDL